jgi:hypothetical protein
MKMSDQLHAPPVLFSGEIILGARRIGCWVGLRFVLQPGEWKKVTYPSLESNPGRPVNSPSLYRLTYPDSKENALIVIREIQGKYKADMKKIESELDSDTSRSCLIVVFVLAVSKLRFYYQTRESILRKTDLFVSCVAVSQRYWPFLLSSLC